ncbi:hypothetical protein [Salaquimonas pukyongi]|uniref:hypothetical protein n=1 Tax=Salaquimonas pukyongi TaxID=2712698 RepID=UPI0013BE9B6D|nr:hypothetical protein [Salaquimonas pukyongi]
MAEPENPASAQAASPWLNVLRSVFMQLPDPVNHRAIISPNGRKSNHTENSSFSGTPLGGRLEWRIAGYQGHQLQHELPS